MDQRSLEQHARRVVKVLMVLVCVAALGYGAYHLLFSG
jgi:hypothetical protein